MSTGKSIYQKDYKEQRKYPQYPQNVERRTNFFPYPDRDHQHSPRYNQENTDLYFDHHNRESFLDRSPRPQYHDNDRLRRSYEDMEMRKRYHEEQNSPRMHAPSYNMHPREYNSPRMYPQEYNGPRMHYPEQSSPRDTRFRTRRAGVYLISRIPRYDDSLREMKHYFERNYSSVRSARGELLGVPYQIFLKYSGMLGYPDWKDYGNGEADNVIAILWFPTLQAANVWATSGKPLKADRMMDPMTSLALLPVTHRPQKETYPTYLIIEVRKRIRGLDAIEDFRQTVVDRMDSVFRKYPSNWCSPFVVDTYVDYEIFPELQLLTKWMDKTFVFLHNFQNKYDAMEFLDHFLDSTHDSLIGPYVATIFDLK